MLLWRAAGKNEVRGMLNAIQALDEELGIAIVKLDVVLRSGAGFKADGLADDERNGLSFGLADALRGAVAALWPRCIVSCARD